VELRARPGVEVLMGLGAGLGAELVVRLEARLGKEQVAGLGDERMGGLGVLLVTRLGAEKEWSSKHCKELFKIE